MRFFGFISDRRRRKLSGIEIHAELFRQNLAAVMAGERITLHETWPPLLEARDWSPEEVQAFDAYLREQRRD